MSCNYEAKVNSISKICVYVFQLFFGWFLTFTFTHIMLTHCGKLLKRWRAGTKIFIIILFPCVHLVAVSTLVISTIISMTPLLKVID